MAVVAAGFILAASRIQAGFLTDPLGSKTFPYLIGGVGLLCSLVLVIRPDADPEWPTLKTWGALAVALVVLIAYAYALRPFGFLIPTALAAGILSYQIGPRPLPAVASGLGLSIGLFALFRYVLGLSLAPWPRGWF